jgi:hypothetical protein
MVCQSAIHKWHRKQLCARIRSGVICLVVDNTGSMATGECMSLQTQFCIDFLGGLHSSARVFVKLVHENARPNPWVNLTAPLRHRGCYDPQTTLELLEKAWANYFYFYSGSATPILSTLASEPRFGSTVLVTDGEETAVKSAESFGELQIRGVAVSTLLERYNATARSPIKFRPKRPIEAMAQLLLICSNEREAVFTAIVGLDNESMGKMHLDGMTTINLVSSQHVKSAADVIRTSTVPSEAGGGNDAKPKTLLRQAQAQQVSAKKKATALSEYLGRQRTLFWDCTTQEAQFALLARRKEWCLAGRAVPDHWLVRGIPPPSERTGGWYLRWQHDQRKAACEEAKKTQDAAVEHFSRLCQDDAALEQLTREVASKFCASFDDKLKRRKNKKKNHDEDGDVKMEEEEEVDGKAGPLTTEDVLCAMKAVSPLEVDFAAREAQRLAVLKRIGSMRPIPLSVYATYHWVDPRTGLTFHEQSLGGGVTAVVQQEEGEEEQQQASERPRKRARIMQQMTDVQQRLCELVRQQDALLRHLV